MSLKIIALIIAALAGGLMAVQGSLNTALAKFVGLSGATFIVHLIGVVAIALFLIIGIGEAKLGSYLRAPWYAYLGGLFSVLIIYAVAYSIRHIGVAKATTAIILAQVSTALLVDHFGFFGLKEICFTLYKGLGVLLLAGGAYLMLMD
ncbi:MAG: DMT family transporter [Dethiobacteria bacterium]|jgi:transporter family-2 protein|nr:DMT family transporter [Bacillota bacterium]